MKTLSQKELISQVNKKGWDITRGEKPKPPPVSLEVQNERHIKSIINAIDGMQLSQNLMFAVNIMAQLHKNQIESTKETDGKRKWNMDVKRDDRGLIKSIIAEEL